MMSILRYKVNRASPGKWIFIQIELIHFAIQRFNIRSFFNSALNNFFTGMMIRGKVGVNINLRAIHPLSEMLSTPLNIRYTIRLHHLTFELLA